MRLTPYAYALNIIRSWIKCKITTFFLQIFYRAKKPKLSAAAMTGKSKAPNVYGFRPDAAFAEAVLLELEEVELLVEDFVGVTVVMVLPVEPVEVLWLLVTVALVVAPEEVLELPDEDDADADDPDEDDPDEAEPVDDAVDVELEPLLELPPPPEQPPTFWML